MVYSDLLDFCKECLYNWMDYCYNPTMCGTCNEPWPSRLDLSMWPVLAPYLTKLPKSGRAVWKDLGDCWIVVAAQSGPLKLLELELK